MLNIYIHTMICRLFLKYYSPHKVDNIKLIKLPILPAVMSLLWRNYVFSEKGQKIIWIFILCKGITNYNFLL